MSNTESPDEPVPISKVILVITFMAIPVALFISLIKYYSESPPSRDSPWVWLETFLLICFAEICIHQSHEFDRIQIAGFIIYVVGVLSLIGWIVLPGLL